MSNLANYSPYNKTYKFIMFQNQAYHQKNKKNAMPCIRSNLRYTNSNQPSFDNPESLYFQEKPGTRSTKRCESPEHSQARSVLLSSRSMREKGPSLQKEKRVIHKNQSFEKFRSKRISHENSELIERLFRADCQIVKNKSSEKSYQKHLKYSRIREKFSRDGVRKHSLALGNQSLLCPTLQGFNNSGLAQKFLQTDLAMSTKLSKRNSNLV